MNEEQKAFMRLVRGNESSNAFTDRVAHLTEDAKRNNEYKRQYMEWERQKAYEFRRGKEEGKEEAKLEAAITLVNKYNASPETAANDMEIPLEKLLESLETRTKSQA